MSVKTILEEIEQDIIDVAKTKFVYNDTAAVPSADDSGLTYERGAEKRGKKLNTCVLYTDIRNSVALTEKHQSVTMGRIYTAFTKAIIKAGRHHKGHTRNIIGDRVMIVFPEDNCFTNAIDCAISINHIAKYIIPQQFPGVDFKCGVGVDHGELRIIKVGIQRHGTEGGENKGLIWTGYPANIASRLTDNASKTFQNDYYQVVRNPINPDALAPLLSFSSLFGAINPTPKRNVPFYLSTQETVDMSPEEFAASFAQYDDGTPFMTGGKLIRFSKKSKSFTYPPILLTETVYNGFKNKNPNRNCIVKKFWTEQKHTIKNVSEKIFGGDINWDLK